MAACTANKIVMYRVKPLAPLSVYTVQTVDDLPLLGIKASPLGNRLVAWTEREVLEFDVVPVGDVDELARFNQIVAPGPGEAVGTRELYLASIATHLISHDILEVLCLENATLVVGSQQYSRLGSEEGVNNWTRYTGEEFKVCRAVTAPLLQKTALISDKGAVKVISLMDPDQPAVDVCSKDAMLVAFNMRLGKLTVASESTIYLYCLDRSDADIVEFPHGLTNVTCLQWSTQGNVLFVGSTEQWTLLSALGATIFLSKSEATAVSNTDGGVVYADWSLASGELFLLCNHGLYVYNVLRWSGLGTLTRPILFTSSRLQLFHDGQKTRLSANPWLIVPLPAFYMAENWPLMYTCCSADGKYVAAAGSTGLMYFSVLSRCWKELPDRDMRVRGGVVWYGRSLIVAVDTDGEYRVQLYSPVAAVTRRNSAVAVPNNTNKEEDRLLSSETLDARVIAMSLKGDQLAVLLQSAVIKIFSLTSNRLDFVDDWRLAGVIPAVGRVRSIDLISSEQVLIFVDDQLTSLTRKENGVYKKQILAEPIEYYFVDERNLWLFDGQELSLHHLDGDTEPLNTQFKVDEDGVYFKVDGYPVAINPPKGVVATIEAHGLTSKDGFFGYIKPTAHIQVYLLHLLQDNLEQLHKYAHLDYYDQVLQSLLNRALINNRQLAEMVDIVKRTAKSWRHVVASCARKVEAEYWPRLFKEVGESPAQLFDAALADGDLESASEFLIVVHADKESNQGVEASGTATQQLFKAAFKAGKMELCREVCEFLLAVDESGEELKQFQRGL